MSVIVVDETPFITVAVITYNQQRYVGRSIEGILKQECEYGIEVLIADDASTDGTDRILQEYADRHPDQLQLNIQKKNVGATRNSYDNYMRAKGKYIASLEGDDYWIDSHYLQRGIDFLEVHSEFVAVAYRSQIIDADGNAIDTGRIERSKRFWEFEREKYTREDFCQWKMPGQMSAVIMRNIFSDMGKDEAESLYLTDRIVGDRTIMMFLTQRGVIACKSQVTAAYRYDAAETGTAYMASMKRKNRRMDEFSYMCRLEERARSLYGDRNLLKYAKKNKLTGAISVYIRSKAKADYDVVKEIMKMDQQPVRDRILLLQVWMFKLWCKYILREDRRFPI